MEAMIMDFASQSGGIGMLVAYMFWNNNKRENTY